MQRHIIRNHVFIHALENDLDVPIGVQDGDEMDTLLTDKDIEALAEFNTEEQHDERYAEHAKQLYAVARTAGRAVPAVHADLLAAALKRHGAAMD